MTAHPFQNLMVRYETGDRIFQEGELGTTMYIVQSGRVRLFRSIDGKKRVHGEMEKGDFFGEMSVLEGLPRTVSAEAVEDTELIEINSLTFGKMIKGNIEIAVRMLRKLSIRLRAAERQIEELEAGGARARRSVRDRRPAPTPLGKKPTSGARLEVEGRTFPLAVQETIIGRYDPVTEQRPDVDLTPVDLKRTVSRRHARIVRSNDGYTISEEVGALNGTFVNGTKLAAGRAHPIREGDRISVGSVKLLFHV